MPNSPSKGGLIDHGDGTGEYRGWRLEKVPCANQGCTCGGQRWLAFCPHETDGQAFALANGFVDRGNRAHIQQFRGATFARHEAGDYHDLNPTIKTCIDRWEAARDELMAAAFSGVDDGRPMVRIERKETKW